MCHWGSRHRGSACSLTSPGATPTVPARDRAGTGRRPHCALRRARARDFLAAEGDAQFAAAHDEVVPGCRALASLATAGTSCRNGVFVRADSIRARLAATL